MAEGRNIGRAHITVGPDLTGFQAELKAKLDAMRAAKNVDLNPNTEEFRRQLAVQLATIHEKVGIGANFDPEGLRAKVGAAAAAAGAGQKVHVGVDLDQRSVEMYTVMFDRLASRDRAATQRATEERQNMYARMFDQIEAREAQSRDRSERETEARTRMYSQMFDRIEQRGRQNDQAEALQTNRRIDMWRGMFDQIEENNRRTGERVTRDWDLFGDQSGRNFISRFMARVNSESGQLSRRDFSDTGENVSRMLTSAYAPLLAPGAITAIAGAGAGALASMLPAVTGLAAVLPSLAGSFMDVQKAASQLTGIQYKYNEAAQRVSTTIKDGNPLWKAQTGLMSGMSAAQVEVIGLLSKQNIGWADLSAAQQDAAVQLRNSKATWKELTQSQKDAIQALLDQKAALALMPPAQAAAAIGYANMGKEFLKYKEATSPETFRLFAASEQLVIDLMPKMIPLVKASTNALTELVEKMRIGVNSPEFAAFLQRMTVQAPNAIKVWFEGAGNLVVGLVKLLENWKPLGDSFLTWLDKVTTKFREWGSSPKGMEATQTFLNMVREVGPPASEALKNFLGAISNIFQALAGNGFALQMLSDMMEVFKKITDTPIGQFAIQTAAWALAIRKLAEALGILRLAQIALAATQASIGGAAAAGGAAGAASRAAAAGAGGAAAAGGGGALSTLAGYAAMTPAALAGVLGATAFVAGIGAYIGEVHKKSLEAKGVIETVGGQYAAASQVAGTKVSGAFQRMAQDQGNQATAVQRSADDLSGKSSHMTGVIVHGTEQVAGGMMTYSGQFDSGNKAISNIMYVGRTEFGQNTALFVNQWTTSINTFAENVKKSGKTIDEQFAETGRTLFQKWSIETPENYQKLYQATSNAQKDHFTKIEANTKTDYEQLKTATNSFIDATKQGNQEQAQKSWGDLKIAIDRFMQDSTNGNINTANTQIQGLGRTVSKLFEDMAAGNATAVGQDIKELGQKLSGDFQGSMQDLGTQASKAMQSMYGAFTTYVKGLNLTPSNLFKGAIGNQPFAEGGLFRGVGGPKEDANTISISDGEFVVNAAATARNLPVLMQINDGANYAGKFANGGLVGAMGSMTADGAATSAGAIEGMATLLSGLGKAGDQQKAAQNLGGTIPEGDHLSIINLALGAAKVPPPGDLAAWQSGLNTLITRESNWNSGSINNYDINAINGVPSQGLAQVIPPTFAAYHVPGYSNILAPVDNVAAAIRYIVATYGNISNVQQANANLPPKGYDHGGEWPSGTIGYNLSGASEGVLTAAGVKRLGGMSKVHALNSGRGGGGTVTTPVCLTLELDGDVLDQRTYYIVADEFNKASHLIQAGLGSGG